MKEVRPAQTENKPIITSNYCTTWRLFIQVLLHASSTAAVAAATAEETTGAVVEAPARGAEAAAREVVAAQRSHGRDGAVAGTVGWSTRTARPAAARASGGGSGTGRGCTVVRGTVTLRQRRRHVGEVVRRARRCLMRQRVASGDGAEARVRRETVARDVGCGRRREGSGGASGRLVRERSRHIAGAWARDVV